MQADKYLVNRSLVKDPPVSFGTRLKFLGPGFILSASIVGSGELIATTILGSQAGFVAFWVILVSCFIKVAIQLEFGRTAIFTGETVMTSFSALSGKSRWAVWIVCLLTLMKIVQVGGMLGGSALVLARLFPAVSVSFWVAVLAIAVALLVYKNYYRVVERVSMAMVALFTLFTVVSVIAVAFTPYRFSFIDIAAGLGFRLPRELLLVAVGAFGITGVASDEILAYNYWCIEKGYAAYTGPYDTTHAWRKRARGWIRVMQLDAVVAMIIYTLVTAAFYLLGAAILHGRGEVPGGNRLVELIANIYTETLGRGVRNAYLVGAFFVLFSSVFATLAYWTRLFPDIAGQFGWITSSDLKTRTKAVAILAWSFPVLWMVAYYFIGSPVFMILSGGVIGAVLLFLIAYAALWFRYHRNVVVAASPVYDIFLWLSAVSILLVGIYGVSVVFT